MMYATYLHVYCEDVLTYIINLSHLRVILDTFLSP